jgi:hypothetical protein
VATNLGWESPGLQWRDGNPDVSLASFLRPLPGLVLNPREGGPLPLSEVRQHCTCGNLCHLDDKSFIGRYPELVQEMLTPLYQQHVPRMQQIDRNTSSFVFQHSSPLSEAGGQHTPPPLPTIPVSAASSTY